MKNRYDRIREILKEVNVNKPELLNTSFHNLFDAEAQFINNVFYDSPLPHEEALAKQNKIFTELEQEAIDRGLYPNFCFDKNGELHPQYKLGKCTVFIPDEVVDFVYAKALLALENNDYTLNVDTRFDTPDHINNSYDKLYSRVCYCAGQENAEELLCELASLPKKIVKQVYFDTTLPQEQAERKYYRKLAELLTELEEEGSCKFPSMYINNDFCNVEPIYAMTMETEPETMPDDILNFYIARAISDLNKQGKKLKITVTIE